MNNEVKIIGGKYRGKKIFFPQAPDLRPTSNRVKETVFNWLMHDIRNSHCLDAFAGSGSLGFEAISRGAASVCFLEHNPNVLRYLQKTAQEFSQENLTIIAQDTLSYLKRSHESFDIIFLDPPFSGDLLDQSLDILGNNNILRVGGLLYIEAGLPPIIDHNYWEELKSKQAGQVYYLLLRKKEQLNSTTSA